MNEHSTRRVGILSDTVLYQEANAFINRQDELPEFRQFVGLATFSRDWATMMAFIKHQGERDWAVNKQYYKRFYDELRSYLDSNSGTKKGLRQRVLGEFELVQAGLVKSDEKKQVDYWAELLAQAFIQHLVASARLRLEA